MADWLRDIIQSHKNGAAVGIFSVCSANRFVIKAAIQQARADQTPVLIESTSNQVDQFGGYSGMTPDEFANFVGEIGDQLGFPRERLIIGGDHLGPNVWRDRPAEDAMNLAGEQIRAYVEAGFHKIHLDTSMRCANDPGAKEAPLDPEIIARRAAKLCRIAEDTFNNSNPNDTPPVYIIGTEVPPPGGAREKLEVIEPTRVENLKETIELTRRAFYDSDLQSAWERVVAVVVQPGVEFGDMTIVEYNRSKAAPLKQFIESNPQMVYEAHSTDYQQPSKLKEMVEDHFAILKVGPALTFAFREAVFALEALEREWLGSKKNIQLSNLSETMETVMLSNPRYWEKHYPGNKEYQRLARKYSYSDRIRYYWPHPTAEKALKILLSNLSQNPPPLNLISSFLPHQYRSIREGIIRNDPYDLIYHKIRETLQGYVDAVNLKAYRSKEKKERITPIS
ncbi:MAG: tagatose-bisphosphate aldolase subunit KbaZ [Calditrichia bacterium]